jgi:hypothetical protein
MNSERTLRAMLAVLVPALLLAGCDESDPVAPPGSTIILSASPTTLPSGGGDSSLTAVVIDGNGVPQDGVAVFFSTNAGSLASQGISQATDGNGRATDILTTNQSAQVDAQSGDATAQRTVTVGGQQLVGEVTLSCNPISGNAPLSTTCDIHVSDTNFQDLGGVFVAVDLTDQNADALDGQSFRTDPNGNAQFDVANLTLDNSTITASSGGKSDMVTIDITGP